MYFGVLFIPLLSEFMLNITFFIGLKPHAVIHYPFGVSKHLVFVRFPFNLTTASVKVKKQRKRRR